MKKRMTILSRMMAAASALCIAGASLAQSSSYPCDFKTDASAPNWKQAHLVWPPYPGADWPSYVAPVASASAMLLDNGGRVFFVGTDGKVYNYYWDNNTDWEIQQLNYNQWANIDPAGGLKTDATGKIFGIGTDGKVYNFYWSNNAWQFQALVPSQYATIDARGGLTIDASGKIFAIGTDGKVYNYYWTGSAWAFNWLNPNQYATIDARGGLSIDQNGKIYGIGTDGKVYNYYWTGSSWAFNWLVSNPYASIDARGKLLIDNLGKIYGIGTDGKVYNYYWTGSSWAFNWLVSNPYALLNPVGGLAMDQTGKIFGIGNDGKVYNYYWTGSSWAFNWLVSNPYATANASGGISIDGSGKIFVIGTDGKVYNYYWTGSSWAFNWLSQQQTDAARASNKLALNSMLYYVDVNGHLQAFYYAGSQLNYADWDIVYDEPFTTTDMNGLKNNWILQYPWGPTQSGSILAGYEWEYNLESAFSISGGNLKITANNQPYWAKLIDALPANQILSDSQSNYRQFNFTAGAMTSKTAYLYGLFEINCKFPAGKGFWPAFWLTGANSWPPEIDVLEFDGTQTSRCSNNVHWRIDPSTTESCGMDYGTASNLADGFHKYSMAWYSDRLVFYIDGQELRTVDHHVPQTAMYVITNLAIGIHYPDANTVFPSDFVIDYIRIYEQHKRPSVFGAEETAAVPAAAVFETYPNPVEDKLCIRLSGENKGGCTVQVFDLEGRRLADQHFREGEELSLDLSGYAAGAYVVQVYTAGGVLSKKIIRN